MVQHCSEGFQMKGWLGAAADDQRSPSLPECLPWFPPWLGPSAKDEPNIRTTCLCTLPPYGDVAGLLRRQHTSTITSAASMPFIDDAALTRGHGAER